MHLSRSKASDKADMLKAVHKRLEAKEKKNGCSQKRGSYISNVKCVVPKSMRVPRLIESKMSFLRGLT